MPGDGRDLRAPSLWLDGARVPLGEDLGCHLVSGAPAQRQAGSPRPQPRRDESQRVSIPATLARVAESHHCPWRNDVLAVKNSGLSLLLFAFLSSSLSG